MKKKQNTKTLQPQADSINIGVFFCFFIISIDLISVGFTIDFFFCVYLSVI